LVNLNIGSGFPTIGSFNLIDWGTNSKFVEIEIDDLGGCGYVSMGTSELLSVPYALYSERASGGVWNSSGNNIYYDGGFVGIGTSASYSDLIVKSSGYTHGMYVLSDDDDPLFRVRQHSDGSSGIYLYDIDGSAKLQLNGNTDSYINSGNLAIGNTSALGRLSVEAPSGSFMNFSLVKSLVIKDGTYNSGNEFEIQNSSGETKLVFTDAGRLGIGISNPSSGLHLKGTNWPNSFLYLQSDDSGDAGLRLYEGETQKWHIFNNATDDRLVIYNSDGSETVFIADQTYGNVGI